MTNYISVELYSDMHKDAYGFRPSLDAINAYAAKSEEEKEQETNWMSDQINEDILRQEDAWSKAAAEFEASIKLMARWNSISRATAIKWLFQAEEDDVNGDFDYFAWKNGLSMADGAKYKEELLAEYPNINTFYRMED